MKYLFVFFSLIFFSLSSKAQTEKAKEKFIKQVFKDFQKNRLDAITARFIDSTFLDELITVSIKEKEDVTKRYGREKIHKQSKQARAQLSASLKKAYAKYENKGLEKKLANVKPEVETYSGNKGVVTFFGMKYTFELEDYEVEMTIGRVIYDKKRKRFFIMSNRIKNYFLPNGDDLKVAEIKEEKIYEREELVIDDDYESVPQPPAVSPERIRKNIEANKQLEKGSVAQARSADEVFQIVETLPEFPGGQEAMMRFIVKNIDYPLFAKENGIEGKVFTQFVVGKDGKLRNLKVLRGIGGGCDKEALRVLKQMPAWKPGTQRGKAVSVMFTLPFYFKLK